MKQHTGKPSQKERTIAGKVILKITITMLIINLCVIATIGFMLDFLLAEAENKYMSQVIERISSEVEKEISHSVDIANSFAQNSTMIHFLEDAESSPADLNQVPNFPQVQIELDGLHRLLGDSVLNACLVSVAKDSVVDHLGTFSSTQFSLIGRPYYNAVTEKSTYISDPYQDIGTSSMVFTVASPIFHSLQPQTVIGLILVDIKTESISDYVTSSTFGETGSAFLIDRNNNILVHENSNYLGENISVLKITGNEITSELLNPTGTFYSYKENGISQIGGIATIGGDIGWKIMSSMSESEYHKQVFAVVNVLALMQLMGVIISVVVSALSIRAKLSPMEELENYMEEMALGNLSYEFDFSSDDEIGRLADNMRYTAKTLSSYIHHIDHSLKELGYGNFQKQDQFKYHGDFISIKESLEEFVLLMSGSLTNLCKAVDEVHGGAEQLSGGAQLLAHGSMDQAESVQNLNGLIAEINFKITDTAKSSGSVNENAHHISEDLVTSNNKMQELVVSVSEIKTMSNEVKDIIGAIEEVAFQTNILALNAAVEAARAGSAGRGFAVVADEVRNLSLKTSEAVENTTKIISDIATAIETSSDLALRTSKDLQSVVQDVDLFVETITSISLSTQNQADAITEINNGIDEISAVISKNTAISEESAAASEQLTTQSGVMRSLIGQFHLR